MNNYDEIKKIYDNNTIYNNEFLNYDDDFSFWTYWIEKIKPKKVLEIGIGNGRLIKLLSSSVLQYDGLDISKKIIDDFIKENSWYKDTLFNQDMKSININNTYNLIILPFNTFCYLYTLNDIRQFFEGINKISDSNTIIIIDIVNYNYDNISDTKKYKLCNEFIIDDKVCRLYEKHSYDCGTQIINYSKKYVFSDGKISCFNLPVRIFFHQELLNLFHMFGYEIKNVLGDYNNELYNANSRKQIIFIKRSDKK